MDRHEMRFIVRTRIYHACSAKGQELSSAEGSLHDTLTHFCSDYLKGYTVFGIDLVVFRASWKSSSGRSSAEKDTAYAETRQDVGNVLLKTRVYITITNTSSLL